VKGIVVRLALIGLAGLVVAACTDEPPLPAYQGEGVCYPVGLTPDPAGRYLYVAGANFNRAFRGGVVRVYDTKTDSFTDASTVQIPSFASTLTPQVLPDDGKTQRLRMYVAARDDDSVTAVQARRTGTAAPTIGCNGKKQAGCPEKCDKKATFGGEKESDLNIGVDPIELSLAKHPNGADKLLHVAATGDGRMTVLQVAEGANGEADITGIGHITLPFGLADTVTSPLTGRTYVSNSRAPRLYTYSVDYSSAGPASSSDDEKSARGVRSHRSVVLPSAGAGEYGRGMALSADGSRLYLAYRNPNALVVVDIAPDITGEPADRVLGVIGLGGSPARVLVAPTGPKGRELVYVSCYGSDDIWVVDPSVRSVLGVARLPHSPYAMAAVLQDGGGWALYAALFTRHSIARIPLTDGLPPSGDYATWLKELKTSDCENLATPEEVKACE